MQNDYPRSDAEHLRAAFEKCNYAARPPYNESALMALANMQQLFFIFKAFRFIVVHDDDGAFW